VFTAAPDPRVQQIVRLVDTALNDPTLSVARIANEVHLSVSQTRYLMQHHLGTSPKQYLLQKRLLRAQQLLESSFLTIKEVMVAVGMNDPTHFGRQFKRTFGVAPRQYRKWTFAPRRSETQKTRPLAGLRRARRDDHT
jgi:transcriptional regulator GlxA family with amidase domain